ncbi:hypothetical protein EVAR_8365_1 [Eumeta japonica]|uniref:Uncharacterized protein n=1 Tax=Eumeta variegata TaxID=151549 RepID=A0A4C1VCF4_EUMVA|nr:hypothetical protein EVAR_8365_1 [Eumeta japonica]
MHWRSGRADLNTNAERAGGGTRRVRYDFECMNDDGASAACAWAGASDRVLVAAGRRHPSIMCIYERGKQRRHHETKYLDESKGHVERGASARARRTAARRARGPRPPSFRGRSTSRSADRRD